VARLDGEAVSLVGRDTRPTPQSGPESVVGALVASANAAIAAAKVRIGDIAAAGLSAPGPLDHKTAMCRSRRSSRTVSAARASSSTATR